MVASIMGIADVHALTLAATVGHEAFSGSRLPGYHSRAHFVFGERPNLKPFACMKFSLIIALLLPALAFGSGTVAKTREQKIALTESREVIIAVPDGFSLVTGRDDSGVLGVKLSGPKESVTIDLQFLPDPEGKYASTRARLELMHEMFNEYVDDSTEKAMQFEELDSRVGAGSYCVFTDTKLVGKTDLSAGEYVHLTTGVKSWPGVITIFRCFSNDTTSPAYKAIMAMLRESVNEKPAPLK
jgi:hypothetical protein